MKKPVGRGEWMLLATPIVAVVPLWLGGAINAWPVEWRWSYKMEAARRDSCQSSLKQLSLALAMYSQDYNEHYPRLSTGGSGWSDLLSPYLPFAPAPGVVHFLTCPSMPKVETRSTNWQAQSNFRDYWLNARLAQRAVK